MSMSCTNMECSLCHCSRMMKHAKLSPGTKVSSGPATAGSRFSYVNNKFDQNTNKENSTCKRTFSMDLALMRRLNQVSPSKFAITKQISRERVPLEDQDPNSQDSGYSNDSSIFSEDSSTNFRFAEPNKMVPPRRTYTAEFSPVHDSTSSMVKTNAASPRCRQRFQLRISNDSMSSDFSDDGFGENILSSPGGTMLMEKDENTQLPAGFGSLMSGAIRNLSKLNDSPNPSEDDDSFLRPSLRRSLSENITPTRISVRTLANESELSELMLLEKDALKRMAADEECGFSIKRRKSSPKLKIGLSLEKNSIGTCFGRSWSMSGPASAPATSTRGTLFRYGFKKSIKLTRSFSETESSIKNAVQRAISNPELIGDYSKSFILPSEMAQCGNTRTAYLRCDTLAKLMNGEYDSAVRSFTIIDCRFPYEFDGGHIRGAINIHTEEQMNEELKQNCHIHKAENSTFSNKRDILIFHCEFSSKRGPKMMKHVRNEDRNKNFNQYPKLDYPEIYLLQGGYSNFYKHYKNLCDPCGYCPMR